MPRSTEGPDGTGYELLDVGVLRRLERFGPLTIDRPAPGAGGFRLAPEAWSGADLRFDAGAGWSGPAWPAEPWPVSVSGLTMELRCTASGGLGLYPEHAANLPWLERQVAEAQARGRQPTLLNLFAHTGLATLAAARAGASVAHVDAARSTVAWARWNAELNGFADRPIRWLVDDAMAFVAREARRGRRYDGIVLDPPTFGRAGRREWRLEDGLPDLVAACATVAADDAFVLLTAHATGLGDRELERVVANAFDVRPGRLEHASLGLVAASGARLELGWAVRLGA